MQLLALLSTLALLVCNAAAGLASRLTGGLALATTTVFRAVAQVASLNRLDMFHGFTFHFEIYVISLTQPIFDVNPIFHTALTVLHTIQPKESRQTRTTTFETSIAPHHNRLASASFSCYTDKKPK